MYFIAEGYTWMIIEGVDPCTTTEANGLHGHAGGPGRRAWTGTVRGAGTGTVREAGKNRRHQACRERDHAGYDS